jgi:hypothetical protein
MLFIVFDVALDTSDRNDKLLLIFKEEASDDVRMATFPFKDVVPELENEPLILKFDDELFTTALFTVT